MLYPLKLSAPLKDYIWGGTRLKDEFGKDTPLATIAESWELSCHKDGVCRIQNGQHRDKLLTDYLAESDVSLLGANTEQAEDFPVLIKLIDAADNLSIQVHPNDAYAREKEGQPGKTEMWYVVDCEPDASLIYGFTHEITREEFKRRIADHTLLEVCNQVPVKKGDVFFIESGTLHAIGKGILIAEIQQNSNVTYRVYDFGRVGSDGNPRELHIDKALEVTSLTKPSRKPEPEGKPQQKDGYTQTLLASCRYFTVHRLEIDPYAGLEADDSSFHSLLALEGKLELNQGDYRLTLNPGESIFIPAGMGEYRLSGQGTVLLSTV